MSESSRRDSEADRCARRAAGGRGDATTRGRGRGGLRHWLGVEYHIERRLNEASREYTRALDDRSAARH